MKKLLIALLFVAYSLTLVGGAQASVVTIPDSALIPSTTYYTDSIGGGIGNIVVMTGGGSSPGIGDPTGRNDDGFSGPVNLGFTLSFFGASYTQFFLNNNGNVSFGAGISAFTPQGPQGATQPIISPFFADVDTRGAASGVLHFRNDIANEDIITWDQVGYFGAHDDKLNSFQLVLRGPNFNVPVGEGSIGFFYKSMQWETGDASQGSGGFGGFPAAVGFGDGQSNGEVLQGSTANGISGIVNDTHIWFGVNLVPIPPTGVPEPSTLVLLLGSGLMTGGGFAWRRHRRR
jgi:hypothetical protein